MRPAGTTGHWGLRQEHQDLLFPGVCSCQEGQDQGSGQAEPPEPAGCKGLVLQGEHSVTWWGPQTPQGVAPTFLGWQEQPSASTMQRAYNSRGGQKGRKGEVSQLLSLPSCRKPHKHKSFFSPPPLHQNKGQTAATGFGLARFCSIQQSPIRKGSSETQKTDKSPLPRFLLLTSDLMKLQVCSNNTSTARLLAACHKLH